MDHPRAGQVEEKVMCIGKRSNWVVVTLRGGVGEGGSWGREPSSFNLASASVNEGGDEKRQDVKFTLADFVPSLFPPLFPIFGRTML